MNEGVLSLKLGKQGTRGDSIRQDKVRTVFHALRDPLGAPLSLTGHRCPGSITLAQPAPRSVKQRDPILVTLSKL